MESFPRLTKNEGKMIETYEAWKLDLWSGRVTGHTVQNVWSVRGKEKLYFCLSDPQCGEESVMFSDLL